MMNNLYDFFWRNRRGIIQVLIFLASITAIYIFIKHLFAYVSPFVVGWLVSLALFPLVKLIHSRTRLPKAISAAISLILAIAAIGIVVIVIGAKIRKEAIAFSNELPRYLAQVTEMLASLETSLADFTDILPTGVQTATNTAISSAIEKIASTAGSLFQQGSLNAVSNLPGALFFTLITIISAVFFTVDKEVINGFVSRQLPRGWKNVFYTIRHNLFSAFAGYFVAECKVACITFAICLVGLMILGFKYALLIALVVAFVDFLPVFGSGFILWPWSLYNILSSDLKFAVGLIIIYLSILITRQIVEPRLVGRHIGLHPLVTLMSMYVCIRLMGASGILIGPIFVLTVKTLQKENLLPNWR